MKILKKKALELVSLARDCRSSHPDFAGPFEDCDQSECSTARLILETFGEKFDGKTKKTKTKKKGKKK